MTLVQSMFGGSALLRASGSIDKSNAAAFKEALMGGVSRASDALIVDLAEVQHITSEGLASLMSAQRAARGRCKQLVLAAPSPTLLEVLAISQMNRMMPVYAAVREALEALGEPKPAAVTP